MSIENVVLEAENQGRESGLNMLDQIKLKMNVKANETFTMDVDNDIHTEFTMFQEAIKGITDFTKYENWTKAYKALNYDIFKDLTVVNMIRLNDQGAIVNLTFQGKNETDVLKLNTDLSVEVFKYRDGAVNKNVVRRLLVPSNEEEALACASRPIDEKEIKMMAKIEELITNAKKKSEDIKKEQEKKTVESKPEPKTEEPKVDPVVEKPESETPKITVESIESKKARFAKNANGNKATTETETTTKEEIKTKVTAMTETKKASANKSNSKTKEVSSTKDIYDKYLKRLTSHDLRVLNGEGDITELPKVLSYLKETEFKSDLKKLMKTEGRDSVYKILSDLRFNYVGNIKIKHREITNYIMGIY